MLGEFGNATECPFYPPFSQARRHRIRSSVIPAEAGIYSIMDTGLRRYDMHENHCHPVPRHGIQSMKHGILDSGLDLALLANKRACNEPKCLRSIYSTTKQAAGMTRILKPPYVLAHYLVLLTNIYNVLYNKFIG